MTKEELKRRTQVFALRIMRLVDAIPATRSGDVIGRQIARSGTSVGANYRAACRAKSDRDFLNKLVIIEEEADETEYWLDLLSESGMIKAEQVAPLQKAAHELTAIFTASGKTVRERVNNTSRQSRSQVSEEEVDYGYRPTFTLPEETVSEKENSAEHNPKSALRNPKSSEHNPKSEIRNPKSSGPSA